MEKPTTWLRPQRTPEPTAKARGGGGGAGAHPRKTPRKPQPTSPSASPAITGSGLSRTSVRSQLELVIPAAAHSAKRRDAPPRPPAQGSPLSSRPQRSGEPGRRPDPGPMSSRPPSRDVRTGETGEQGRSLRVASILSADTTPLPVGTARALGNQPSTSARERRSVDNDPV